MSKTEWHVSLDSLEDMLRTDIEKIDARQNALNLNKEYDTGIWTHLQTMKLETLDRLLDLHSLEEPASISIAAQPSIPAIWSTWGSCITYANDIKAVAQ